MKLVEVWALPLALPRVNQYTVSALDAEWRCAEPKAWRSAATGGSDGSRLGSLPK